MTNQRKPIRYNNRINIVIEFQTTNTTYEIRIYDKFGVNRIGAFRVKGSKPKNWRL